MICTSCRGEGTTGPKWEDTIYHVCHGTGEIPRLEHSNMRTRTIVLKPACDKCNGTGELKLTPKFVQLQSSPAGMFALADDGTVWVYCRSPRDGWKPVAMNQLSKD